MPHVAIDRTTSVLRCMLSRTNLCRRLSCILAFVCLIAENNAHMSSSDEFMFTIKQGGGSKYNFLNDTSSHTQELAAVSQCCAMAL